MSLLASRRCIQCLWSSANSFTNVVVSLAPSISSGTADAASVAVGSTSHLASICSSAATTCSSSRTEAAQHAKHPRSAAGREESRTEEQAWQHNLAMQNAPRKVFELIGDPRTGLADNVTSNPFGEITVDMLHHQLSNEVYWYKYEFSGNSMTETRRDARLSEHSKNLMYILRAKDPRRWTVEALARKFHIRRQRVLAILTLKEMEAHRMEIGSSLAGPLSGFACPIYLDAVLLDPKSREPLENAKLAAGAAAMEASTLENQVADLQQMAQQVQVQLLQALQPFGYSLESMKQELSSQISLIEEQLQRLVPLTNKAAAADQSAETSDEARASPQQSAAAHWTSMKQQLETILQSAQQVLGVSDVLQEESLLVSTSHAVKAALEQGEASAADAGTPVVELLEGWKGRRLLRLVLELKPPQRKQLLEAVPRVSVDLMAQGIDLEALTTNVNYQGLLTSPKASDSGTPQDASPLPHDVLGFRPVSDDQLQSLIQNLASLEQSVAALGDLVPTPSGNMSLGTSGKPSAIGSLELKKLMELRRTYLSTESMVAAVQRPKPTEGQQSQSEENMNMMILLNEADPSYPSRAQKYDVVMSMLEAGRTDVALLALQELEGSEQRAQAVLQAMLHLKSSSNEPLSPDQVLEPGESVTPQAKDNMHKHSWDLMAAFIDNRVASKVYNRGSGERHIVRLPTYPNFQGYSLEDFDQATEGEISQLNREVAKREEDELVHQFRSNLLFNLGLVGPDLWDNSQPQHKPNLASSLDRPMVVYEINGDGDTVYPPLRVVETNGSERALNEQEIVYQDRRRILRSIPYQLQRIRRKTEIQ